MDDKYHRMDGNATRRPRETCSRSGAIEDHDSQPFQRRRHLMMMMMMMNIPLKVKPLKVLDFVQQSLEVLTFDMVLSQGNY